MSSDGSQATRSPSVTHAARAVPVQTIAVTSGKGGVGKSLVAANLATALAMRERRVLLVDGAFGLGQLATLLGASPRYDLGDVVAGRCRLSDACHPGPHGIVLLAAPSGSPTLAALSEVETATLVSAFSDLDTDVDTMVIDVATGLSGSALCLMRAAREVLVVLRDEPVSIDSAAEVVRAVHVGSRRHRFRVLANAVESSTQGIALYERLCRRVERELDVVLEYCGSIPEDRALRDAAHKERAVVDASPRSASSLAFGKLATKVEKWPRPESPGGQMEFFVERLVQRSGTG